MELAVVNTWFRKDTGKKVTYESGGNKSQIDYVLVRRPELSSVTDIKVIGEECIQQHKLLVCIMEVRDRARSQKQKPVHRCRVWKLKDEVVRKRYAEEVHQLLAIEKGKGVENIWKGLKRGLLDTAEKVCGHTSGRAKRRETWWWNEEVAEVVKAKRALFRKWKRTKVDSDKTAYNQAKKKAQTVIYKAQEKARQEFGDMLDSEENRGQIFRVARQIVHKNKDVVGGSCVKDKTGKPVTEEGKIKEVWKEYFEQLLNEEFDWDKEKLEEANEVHGPSEEITIGEVKAAIMKAKTGKAPGPTGVVAEMLKAAVMKECNG
jgi:hypothetical protein